MLIIPAIDIKGGCCVRLLQGDPDKETIYSNDPVAVACSFEDMGAELIHVVDLDGAFSGTPVNDKIVQTIAQAVKIPIEIGGGIRKSDDIQHYLDMGIQRIIIGTIALSDDFKQIIHTFSSNIIVGIDVKDSMVATHGWKKVSAVSATEIIKELVDLGIGEIIYTDIATDGMLSGPNIKSMEAILRKFHGLTLIASGGISSLNDIKAVAKFESLGIKGCIVGKAIYDGRVNLKDAITALVEITNHR